jgi:PAS domain-containing protein
MVDRARCILDSHAARLGVELLARSGDPAVDAAALMDLDAVVLSHDAGADPRFVYANRAAATLWRMPVEELIGMPSRLSAPPEYRQGRSEMLIHAARQGVFRGYSGERVAKDGTRFVIEDATLWTVDGYPNGPGQAVVFRDWELLPSDQPDR